MAYDPSADNLALLKRTFRGVADIRGRARRAELPIYALLAKLVVIVIGGLVGPWLTWRTAQLFDLALSTLLALPMLVIFVRRLHDQDRAGWWGLIIPPLLLLGLWKDWRFATLDPTVLLANRDPLDGIGFWIGLPLALGFVVLSLLPGTIGPNRYGPDPCEGDA